MELALGRQGRSDLGDGGGRERRSVDGRLLEVGVVKREIVLLRLRVWSERGQERGGEKRCGELRSWTSSAQLG